MAHTLSFTHNFVTYSLSHATLTHTIFHTHSLSHTLFHTQLCHTLSFTNNFVTLSFTHNFHTHHLSHTLSFTHNFSILHHLLCLSFLPRPATTFVAHYWKKLTCGVSGPFILSSMLFVLDKKQHECDKNDPYRASRTRSVFLSRRASDPHIKPYFNWSET